LAKEGCVLLLGGEPGIGKTRALAELASLAHARGITALQGACLEGGWQAPYGALKEALADATPLEPIHAVRLRDVLGSEPASAAKVPESADLTDRPAIGANAERLRYFDAVLQLLGSLADAAPLLLVIDDVQWADQDVLALLRLIGRLTRKHALLLALAYRDP